MLLFFIFYFKSGYAQNIMVKFTEIFNQARFLSASLISNAGKLSAVGKQNPEDDLPLAQKQQDQILAEEPGSDSAAVDALVLRPMTQKEIQEELDDISEKIDLLKQQVDELVNSLKPKVVEKSDEKLKEDKKEETDQKNKTEEQYQLLEKPVQKVAPGGGTRPNYQKILISEVLTAGQDDEKQEFVELYNPNDFAVDLTDWYLQRKTAGSSSWSTYASNNLFSGKIIFANGYFLIARAGYYLASADIFTDYSITDDNSFALKNPNGDISDKLGFGQAQDPELLPAINPSAGQSVGRKVLNNGEEEETDNNLNDFELQTPTAKAQNKTYAAPINIGGGGGGGGPAPVVYPKILISEVQILPIDQRFVELYNPNNYEVSFTGWYIQRKTQTSDSWNSFISSPKFEGKKISANSYFLISRQMENSDILSDITLSENNSLVFKNSNGDISDKLGFGLAQDFETSTAPNPDLEKSTGRKWDENSQTYFDTDNNSEDFEIDTPTPKEKNIKWVEPPKDTISPTVIFTLNQTQISLNFAIDFIITDPLDTVTPSGVGSYIFHWKEDPPAGGSDWQEDSPLEVSGGPSSTDIIKDFTGEDGKTYYFQIKAKDLAGNESVWFPVEPVFTKIEIPQPVEAKSILINEIQIEGDTTKNDWVELYNPNDFDIFLSDYNGSYLRLVKRAKSSADDTTIKSWSGELEAKISAKGYYLWVSSTDSSYSLLAEADSATKQNISADNGVALRLGFENTGEIIDAVGWGDFNNVLFETAPVQNPEKNQSIKRKNLGEDTNDNSQDFVISETPTPKTE